MFNRWIGILSISLMVLANAAIIRRDVLPDWYAGDPPPSEALTMQSGEMRTAQVGIYQSDGRHLGTSWTRSRRTSEGGLVVVETTTALKPFLVPGGITTPPVRIETEITYRQSHARLDELDFRIHGLPMPISLHGETMPTGEFPFTWQVGSERGSIALDSRAPAALGDVIRPFDRLPELYVGRSWRVDLLDPLRYLAPNLKNTGLEFEPVLIQVTRTESIKHGGVDVECFVVEGGGATAWVDPSGAVLRQEVNLPFVGRLTLLEEPYDDDARREAIWGRRVKPRGDANDDPDTEENEIVEDHIDVFMSDEEPGADGETPRP